MRSKEAVLFSLCASPSSRLCVQFFLPYREPFRIVGIGSFYRRRAIS